ALMEQYAAIVFLGNALHFGQGLKKVNKKGVEMKLFIQLGFNKKCLSADFQINPYHYFVHTRGLDHPQTLFAWDVTGRVKLEGAQQVHYRKFADMVLDKLNLDSSAGIKQHITTKEDFIHLRQSWFQAFNDVNDSQVDKFGVYEDDDESEADSDIDFFMGEVPNGTTL
ncbi:hypothetical protein HDU76_011134, partial [Blyttiomyces sp. JEL0837]